MENILPVNQTTRSILVIEEEYDLRVSLLESLSADSWNVYFALTEKTIEDEIGNVAGVILNWDLPEIIDRDAVLKTIGELPLIVTSSQTDCNHKGFIQKPYKIADVVKTAKEKFVNNQFFVGDHVISKTTPDWGEGQVVSIYPNDYYGVIFKSDQHRNSSEIALRCHYSGLKWVKD